MAATTAKKLINAVDDVVEESLQGTLMAHPLSLARLGNLHVLVRADVEEAVKHPTNGQVALISGGGSGHEPAHGGFVGVGMLTAAVLGGVFASPSVASILATIRAVTGPKGALLIVKSYTGDKLNFGIAREQALAEGFMVEMIVVADDCALPKAKGITGRRGVAGTVFVHKIAGAAASRGASLEEVKNLAEKAIDDMGSLGLALSVCTVPGSQPSSRLDGNVVELGLGIHGEPGIQQMPLKSADELMDAMIKAIIGKESEGGHDYLPLAPQQDIVIMVNNLGATPPIEISILVRRAVQVLESPPINARIHRVYEGHYMTSLEMAGASLTILKCDPMRLVLLDAPTKAPGWKPASGRIPGATGNILSVPSAPIESSTSSSSSSFSSLSPDLWKQLQTYTTAVANALLAAKEHLNTLDGISGDGDCGLTLARGATACLQLVQPSSPPPATTSAFLVSLACAISDSMGGTSGVLLEILFRAMARSLQESHTQTQTGGGGGGGGGGGPDVQAWATALQTGVERMSFYGGAKPGYRTMIDAFLPAEEALLSKGGLQGAAVAARAGAEKTKTMTALAGRANYVPVEKMQGYPDPGAEAVAIAFEALVSAAAGVV